MALSATVAFDVRTTGSDSNGGGFNVGATGTDFSQQNSAQIAFTDLVIGGTNANLTSALNPFTSAHVGNIINITSGTGFTTGRYQVISVASGVATMDRAVGTASSTGGHGNLGGSLATIQAANTASASGNSIYIQSGTYTFTATMAIAQPTINFIGYQITHGDNGTKPLITTATNSTDLMTAASTSTQFWDNLSFSNTATTRANGFVKLSAHGGNWYFRSCVIDGFTTGINSDNVGAHFDVSTIWLQNCEVKNCTASGIYSNQGTVLLQGTWIHDCSTTLSGGGGLVALNSAALIAAYCIFSNCSGSGSGGGSVNANNLSGTAGPLIFNNCTFSNNTPPSLYPSATTGLISVANCIFYGNLNGIKINSFTVPSSYGSLLSRNNAFGNNSGGNVNWNGSPSDVTLTSNPFTNSAAGDYSLNSTAGGGAACKGAGFPGILPGGTSTGFTDIGAVQTASGGGVGTLPTISFIYG